MENNDVYLRWCLPKCTNLIKSIDNFLVYYDLYLIILFIYKLLMPLVPKTTFSMCRSVEYIVT